MPAQRQLLFIDLPLTDGSTASVRLDEIVAVTDATPRPADRGLPARPTAARSRVITSGSLDVVVAWPRQTVLNAMRAAVDILRAHDALDLQAPLPGFGAREQTENSHATVEPSFIDGSIV